MSFRTEPILEVPEEVKLLDKVSECFQAKKLLKSGGKQRTDSRHILAKVRHLSRMESVVEILRAALKELIGFSSEWRVISFAGREEQEFLDKSQSVSQTVEWQNLHRERAGTEATISQSVRGLRFCGKRDISERQKLICTTNIFRGAAWLEGNLLEKQEFPSLPE